MIPIFYRNILEFSKAFGKAIFLSCIASVSLRNFLGHCTTNYAKCTTRTTIIDHFFIQSLFEDPNFFLESASVSIEIMFKSELFESVGFESGSFTGPLLFLAVSGENNSFSKFKNDASTVTDTKNDKSVTVSSCPR